MVTCSVCKVTNTMRPNGVCTRCDVRPKAPLYKCLLCESRTKNEYMICSKHTKKERENFMVQQVKPIQTKAKTVETLLTRVKQIMNDQKEANPFDVDEVMAKKKIEELIGQLQISDDNTDDVSSLVSARYEVESQNTD